MHTARLRESTISTFDDFIDMLLERGYHHRNPPSDQNRNPASPVNPRFAGNTSWCKVELVTPQTVTHVYEYAPHYAVHNFLVVAPTKWSNEGNTLQVRMQRPVNSVQFRQFLRMVDWLAWYADNHPFASTYGWNSMLFVYTQPWWAPGAKFEDVPVTSSPGCNAPGQYAPIAYSLSS